MAREQAFPVVRSLSFKCIFQTVGRRSFCCTMCTVPEPEKDSELRKYFDKAEKQLLVQNTHSRFQNLNAIFKEKFLQIRKQRLLLFWHFLSSVYFPSSGKLSLLEGRADSGWAFIARDWAVMGAVMFMT